MVENNYERRKKRRGPKPILTTRDTMHLTREVRRLGQQGERVTATKLLKNLDLDCSDQTLRRKGRHLHFLKKRTVRVMLFRFAHNVLVHYFRSRANLNFGEFYQ